MDSLDSDRRGDPSADRSFPDDGVDPRTFFDRRNHDRSRNHKARMLSSQVAECLQLVFDNALHDPDLQDVHLHGVEPGSDAGTLRVTVVVADPNDVVRVRNALGRAAGRLRSEVARAVHRRRVPQLLFRVVPEAEA